MGAIMFVSETREEEAREINGKVVDNLPLNIIEDPAIADLVFKHFTETFTICELVKYKCINKTWKNLMLDNILSTYVRDWYFPLHFKTICSGERGRHAHKWMWSSVHHPPLEFHNLPHIPESIIGAVDEPTYPPSTLLAIAGGLMLFGDGKSYIDSHWAPLMVYNPLTNKRRELPRIPLTFYYPFDDGIVRRHILKMVADEKTSSYKVIITYMDCVFVYKSTSNVWSLRSFPEEAPLEFESLSKAIVDGKIYFAGLEINGEAMYEWEDYMQALAHVTVFEVDDDAGTWKQSMRVALRDYFLDTFDGFMDGSTHIALVESMSRLFAIIPTMLDLDKTVEKEIMEAEWIVEEANMHTFNDYRYLPLLFYILPLGGEGGICQVMIRPLDSTNNFGMSKLEDRRREAMEFLETSIHNNWMSCQSRGSIISMTFTDYLLQYDMVSSKSQTFILPGSSSFDHEDFLSDYYGNSVYDIEQMAYSPSFSMKP